MSKWFKNILALIILGFLLWYLARHWAELKAMLKLSPGWLFVMYCLWFLLSLTSARVASSNNQLRICCGRNLYNMALA